MIFLGFALPILFFFLFRFVRHRAVAVEAFAEGGAGNAEEFGGADLVVAGFLHGAERELTFDPGQDGE